MQSLPITQSNPWAENEKSCHASEAESWLNATASKIDPFACAPSNNAFTARSQPPPQYGRVDNFNPMTNQNPLPQVSYPLGGYAGGAPISSYNHQFYPTAYQIRGNAPQLSTGIPANSAGTLPRHETNFPQQSAISTHQFAGTNADQSGTFYGSPAPQNIQPTANSQHSALDPFKTGNVWPTATNPFKAGSDVPSFQLKI